MSLRTLVPDIEDLVSQSKGVIVVESDGDGTTFKQNLLGNAWDINPAPGVIEALSSLGDKGHRVLLSSAREAPELAASPFKDIPGIVFQGNDGSHQIGQGETTYSFIDTNRRDDQLPSFDAVADHVKRRVGVYFDIRAHNMVDAFGMQMWRDEHQASWDIEEALKKAVSEGLVKDPLDREWFVASPKEGHYVLPTTGRLGKKAGYRWFVDNLDQAVGLHVVCGDGGNDKELLEYVGGKDNGIAFWVGKEADKPPGKNVYAVPNEDSLARVLGELAELAPDRGI
jgi:hypothetical protein